MNKKNNNLIIISGASRGLGKELVLKFQEMGLCYFVLIARDNKALIQLKKVIEKSGNKAYLINEDITSSVFRKVFNN